jgi:hypothetical protein
MKNNYLLLASLLGLSQCQHADPSPVDQLPPATQNGTNTFACLINGQLWRPQGYDGRTNYSIFYAPTYRNGTLNISTYRYQDGVKDADYLTIVSDSLRGVGTYPLTKDGHQEAIFASGTTGCEFMGGKYYRQGTLTITRFDLQKGVISGTFAFTLYKPGCDSLRVTQGHFDKKL